MCQTHPLSIRVFILSFTEIPVLDICIFLCKLHYTVNIVPKASDQASLFQWDETGSAGSRVGGKDGLKDEDSEDGEKEKKKTTTQS